MNCNYNYHTISKRRRVTPTKIPFRINVFHFSLGLFVDFRRGNANTSLALLWVEERASMLSTDTIFRAQFWTVDMKWCLRSAYSETAFMPTFPAAYAERAQGQDQLPVGGCRMHNTRCMKIVFPSFPPLSSRPPSSICRQNVPKKYFDGAFQINPHNYKQTIHKTLLWCCN